MNALAGTIARDNGPHGDDIDSIRSQARRAGLLYAIPGLTVPFALLILPRAVLVGGNPAETAARLRSAEWMVQLGIAIEIVNCSMMVLAMLALYRLFRQTSPALAATMVALFLVSIPVQLANLLNYSAALMMANGAATLGAFSQPQLDALAYTFLRLHSRGIVLAQIYWGLWLLPYSLVVRRSGFIPAWLGIPLFIAGLGYVAHSVMALFFVQYAAAAGPLVLALGAGELPILVWLIGWGAKRQRDPRRSAPGPTP